MTATVPRAPVPVGVGGSPVAETGGRPVSPARTKIAKLRELHEAAIHKATSSGAPDARSSRSDRSPGPARPPGAYVGVVGVPSPGTRSTDVRPSVGAYAANPAANYVPATMGGGQGESRGGGYDLLPPAEQEVGGYDLLPPAQQEVGGYDLLPPAQQEVGGYNVPVPAEQEVGSYVDLTQGELSGGGHDSLPSAEAAQSEGAEAPFAFTSPLQAETSPDLAPYVEVDSFVPQLVSSPAKPRPAVTSKRKGAGDSRRHRAWIVSEISRSYANETSKSQQMFAPLIEPKVAGVAWTWAALQILRPVATSAATDGGAAAYAAAMDVIDRKAIGADRGLLQLGLDPADLAAVLEQLHTKYYEWLRRQDFDIKDDGEIPRLRDGTIDMRARKVKYDVTPEEQERTRVEFKAGLLHRGEKSDAPGPVDTGESVTHFSGPGWEIFVVSPEGEIHMASHKIGKVHHSSLLAASDIAIGGEMRVKNGKIEKMTNKSGHYMPGKGQFQQFLHHLEEDGVALDFAVEGFGVPGGVTARDLATGVNKSGNVESKQSYHSRKLKAAWNGYLAQLGSDFVEDAVVRLGWTGDGKSGFQDAAGEWVDDDVAIKALKSELGAAPRKRRRKFDPAGKPTISWS